MSSSCGVLVVGHDVLGGGLLGVSMPCRERLKIIDDRFVALSINGQWPARSAAAPASKLASEYAGRCFQVLCALRSLRQRLSMFACFSEAKPVAAPSSVRRARTSFAEATPSRPRSRSRRALCPKLMFDRCCQARCSSVYGVAPGTGSEAKPTPGRSSLGSGRRARDRRSRSGRRALRTS